jgi:hypothetical protein
LRPGRNSCLERERESKLSPEPSGLPCVAALLKTRLKAVRNFSLGREREQRHGEAANREQKQEVVGFPTNQNTYSLVFI